MVREKHDPPEVPAAPAPGALEKPEGKGKGHRRPFPLERGEDGLPVVPTADQGPVPRVIADFERAPAGLTRYKVRVIDAAPALTRYVLARTEADAVRAYKEYVQLSVVFDDAGKPREPRFYVKALPD